MSSKFWKYSSVTPELKIHIGSTASVKPGVPPWNP